MVVGEQWKLRHQFNGWPKLGDFELVRDNLGPLEQGEIVYQVMLPSNNLLIISPRLSTSLWILTRGSSSPSCDTFP